MNIDYIKELLVELGFTPKNGSNGIFVKNYPDHDNYPIIVDFNTNKIEYDNKCIPSEKCIRLGDLTTCNFEKLENFVVLECVDRLLVKGYAPECLELEKKYPLGRNLKGKLDIIVYDLDKTTPFLMIECKTWGNEFEKESAKTIKDGGQIFSYYQQDTAAKFLCLYTSRCDKKKIDYCNNIILVDDSWHELSNAKDVHGHWNKNFKDNGIFESNAMPYDIKPKALTYEMLKNLKEEDSGKIFNQIMEILRHNAISDKPNAFNKLLNLFVCKIIDENKNATDELEFQWLETDTDESLQMRLNDLYKKGMWRFLEIKIIDHSEEEIEQALDGIDNAIQKRQLMDMFRDARLKKSPNFAFVEVLDEKTFALNAKIVREIVELLQVYKFRYAQKHEFLGNFFELLLNTSMKQEAGQFFTPVPITRFIISSLPLKEFVQNKINCKESNDILPAVIDYACGSGHFLTEYMDQMQTVIDQKINVSKALPDVRNAVKSWQGLTKFLWAKDTVYGIDLDNRLVKTTKVSAFFNGDGEANIIWANGLGDFEKTEEYRGLLKYTQPYEQKNNGKFDILISNPPYSVDAFKSTLNYGDEAFDLYNNITDNSKEIECLFVERMKQLLKVKGWAGVILPSSILSNGGIYSKTREIIFKYFRVKSIVEFGSGTFMKTGTNTIALFLERRSDNDFLAIQKAIDTFLLNQKDVTVLGIENAFSKYITNVYDDVSFDDYISFIKRKANASMQKHELYTNYQKEFGENIYIQGIPLEKEKMLYFLLTYSQNIVVVKTGKKQEEKKFLGYEFSERRGHEGIKHLPNGTKLYDEDGDLLNPQKANSYIYNAFLNKTCEIDENIAHNVSYGLMSGFINYGTSKFDKTVNLNQRQKIILSYNNVETVLLGDISNIEKGQTFTSAQAKTGSIPVVAGGKEPSIFHNASNRSAGIISVSASGANAGYVNYWDTPIFATDCNTIRAKDDKISLTKYIYICLKSLQSQIYGLQAGQAQPHVYERDLKNIKIPLPSIDVQQNIVTDVEKIEVGEKEIIHLIKSQQERIDNIIKLCFGGSYHLEQLGSLAQIFNGGTPNTKNTEYWNGEINWATLVDTKNKYLYATHRTITEAGLNSCNATLLPVNTVLFSSRATIGDVSIAKIPVSTNQGYKNFVCYENKLNYEFLYYILKHEAKAIEELAKGMTYPEISKSLISTYKIPVPSIKKQQEIVDEINKIETEINKINIKLVELRAEKDKILQKYL